MSLRMYRVTQRFDAAAVADPGAEVRRAFTALELPAGLRPGMRVAVCVGSRGIASLPELVAATVASLRGLGLKPFIVPAMGSHGQACAEGQAALLKSLGVSEDSMGVPVAADMAVEELGRTERGARILFSREALKADWIVPVDRIKPHTILSAAVQSGLCKMLVIGCGKHAGAQEYHKFDICSQLLPAAHFLLQRLPILAGVAVVENAADRLCEVRLVRPERFIETDTELLLLAASRMARLPLDALDLLIIDKIGKDICGSGADLNITGKWRRDGGPRVPDYQWIAALDLTDASHGNALGMGSIDLISERFRRKIDYKATTINAVTCGQLRSGRTPICLGTDRQLLETVLNLLPDPMQARVARIRTTRDLDCFWASAACLAELRARPGVRVDGEALELRFTDRGDLLPPA